MKELLATYGMAIPAPEIAAALTTRKRPAVLVKTQGDDVPKQRGLYAWFEGDAYAYIGIGEGKRGLRGRIVDELKDKVEEWRPKAMSLRLDAFQLSCGVTDEKGRPVIDKSSLRQNLGRAEHLCPGAPTLAYVLQHMSVGWLVIPPELDEPLRDNKALKRWELQLIRLVRPRLNIAGNR
jgi:hypothetical protein